jgi:DNA-binding PadR family transcriptional regulator
MPKIKLSKPQREVLEQLAKEGHTLHPSYNSNIADVLEPADYHGGLWSRRIVRRTTLTTFHKLGELNLITNQRDSGHGRTWYVISEMGREVLGNVKTTSI